MDLNKFYNLFKNKFRAIVPLLVFIILVILFLIIAPGFHKLTNIRTIFLGASIDGLIAIGVTFVIISGGIDLSIGINKAFSAIMCILVLQLTGNIFVALLAGVTSGIVFGFINALIITKGKINPFIATLGTFLIFNGLNLIITKGGSIFIKNINFMNVSHGMLFYINFPIWVFIIIIIITHKILTRTRLGKYIFSIGGDESICSVIGIDVNKYKIIIYTICGGLCGLAGCFLAARGGGASPVFGQQTMFIVIGAVILGGTSIKGGEGGVLKSIIGLLIYLVIQNSFGLLNIDPFYQFYIWGFLIVIITILDSFKQRTVSL